MLLGKANIVLQCTTLASVAKVLQPKCGNQMIPNVFIRIDGIYSAKSKFFELGS